MPLEGDELETVKIAATVSAFLSFIGAGFVVFTFFLARAFHSSDNVSPNSYRYAIMKYNNMLFFLSATEMFDCFAYLSAQLRGDSQWFCITQAVIMHYSELCIIFWILCMGIELNVILIPSKYFTQHSERRHLLYPLWVFGFSALIIVVVLAMLGDAAYTDSQDAAWCWINKKHPEVRFGAYYLWLLIVYVALFLLYVRLAVFLRHTLRGNVPPSPSPYSSPSSSSTPHDGGRARSSSTASTNDDAMYNRHFWRILSYPLLFIFLYLWAIVDRAYQWVNGDVLFALAVLHSIFSPLEGFVNALLYGCSNKRIHSTWRNALRPLLPDKKNESTILLGDDHDNGDVDLELPVPVGASSTEELDDT